MTTNLTVTISNTVYPVRNGSYTLDDKVDERSTAKLTIFDANGTYSFQFGQPITITDTAEGVKFTGFIMKSVAVKYSANAALAWSLDCVDNHFLSDKKTSNRVITNQYAGIAAVGMVSDHLSQDGVVANYAIRDDNTQIDFAQGTLSNTVATSNLGGDLELALAGTTVTSTQTYFPSSFPVIKMVGTSSQGYVNNYHYRNIYSDGSNTVTAGDHLSYNIWIQSDSPEIRAGVDIIFTDGTTFRDSPDAGHNGQGLGPHPNIDLSGYANNNEWLYQNYGVSGALIGKTIQCFAIAFEGDTKGLYTAYFRDIQFLSSSGVKVHVFDSTQNTLQTNSLLLNRGYSNVSATKVQAYDPTLYGYLDLGVIPIDNVKIVGSSYVNWVVTNTAIGPNNPIVQSTINSSATSPTAVFQSSIDGGASWQSISNNSSIPHLQPGMNATSRNIQFRFNLASGIDPTIMVNVAALNCVVNPAYKATKSDSVTIATAQTDFNLGTYSNTQSFTNGGISLTGKAVNYNDVSDYYSQTLYGSQYVYQAHYLNTLTMGVNNATDGRSRLDQAGQWANFIAEIDVQVSANYALGLVYRTTNWGTSNNSYAYSVTVGLTSLLLGRGTNSTGAGAFTQIANSTSINLGEGTWHRIRIIANGSNHKVLLDGAQYINATDGTYTAAGYLGLRIYTSANPAVYGYFDNFGVVSALNGQWTSQNISLASLGNYGTSMIQWDANQIPSSCQVLAVTSIDNGSTYQAVTNGGTISGLTPGQSLSGKNLLVQLQLNAGNASELPIVNGVTAWVQGQYSTSGTRIAPFLSLSKAGIAGSTLAAWTATTPTNTSVSLQTSLDGTNYSSVSNGSSIPGISSQPSPTLDTFANHTGPNYTSTFASGGSSVPWFWDTLNSRLTATGGSMALLLCNSISALDIDIVIDMDQTDTGGVVWRYVDVSNYYQIIVNDASSSNDTNVISLMKRTSGTRNFLASGSIVFVRGTKRRIRVVMQGGVVTVYFDGVLVLTYIDPSPLATGKVGLSHDNGTSQFYNFRIQPAGDSLSGKVVYSKVTLASTDPTVTPQLTDLTVAALHPNIGIGSLIPTADYTNTYISDNFSDLATKSDYTWFIDQNLNFIFGPRVARPAPWILQSLDQQLLIDGPLTVDYSSDLYRNEMILDNVIATNTKSEVKVGDGTTTSWGLGGEIINPPLIYLNNQLKTIGIKGIDTGKDFYWTPGSNAIDQDASGTVLVQTDTLSFQNYLYRYLTSITVDNTNLANTVTQKQFAAIMGRSVSTQAVLNLTSAAHTSSSDTGDFDLSKYRRIAVDISITAVSGTTPAIQFFIDRKDTNGIYYNLWSSSVVNASGPVSTTIGAFATVKQSFGAAARLRWTITGTSPSFTFSSSIIGILDVQSAGLGIVAIKEDVSSLALNAAAATAYGNTLLQKYGTQGRTISFKTWRRNPSLAIGQYLPVFLSEHNINDASMLITAISTSQSIGYENGMSTQIYWQHVTCTENANLGSPWKLLASTLK